MVATRYLHRSEADLEIGDELVSPMVLCERHPKAADEFLTAEDFANFRQYSQGQHANVYFSMVGSYADQFTYNYYGRQWTYVVEPLGPVERDPEDETGRRRGPSGSMRCERAVIREKHRTDAWEPVQLGAS